MKNRFYVTSYPYAQNFEYIFGMILSNLRKLSENRGWTDIKYPTSFQIKEEIKEVMERGFFSREKKVVKTKYLLFFIFEEELNEKDLMFWRGFVLGDWRNY